jgi:hypothetical protein
MRSSSTAATVQRAETLGILTLLGSPKNFTAWVVTAVVPAYLETVEYSSKKVANRTRDTSCKFPYGERSTSAPLPGFGTQRFSSAFHLRTSNVLPSRGRRNKVKK